MKKATTLPPAIFLAGALALDFLNSIATPVDEIVDWMGNGADFLSWMKQARLLTDDEIRTIHQSMTVSQLDAVARDARALRDWLRRFVQEHRGSPLRIRALDQVGPLNRLLGSDSVFWQIEPLATFQGHAEPKGKSAPVFHLRPRRHWQRTGSLLFLLAEEIAKFLCTADFSRIKACEGTKCTLLFLDQSNRGARRWCSMSICGNRAKAAGFAARAKETKRKRMPHAGAPSLVLPPYLSTPNPS